MWILGINLARVERGHRKTGAVRLKGRPRGRKTKEKKGKREIEKE